MGGRSTLEGKIVFVIGGSKGLGREMAKVMAGQGAHITIFARGQTTLYEAQAQVLASRRDGSQRVRAVTGDMGDVSTAQYMLASQPENPDIVLFVAGGAPTELGFLLDLAPESIERCMNNNFYSSLYPAQAVLKRWVEDDQTVHFPPSSPRCRKLIFVNSSAALAPIPGCLAYSSAKAAQRALAETMRLEAMRYSGPVSKYVVQCIFAHNFITSTFLQEQRNKPELCKRIEAISHEDISNLESHFSYAEKVAPEIIAATMTDDFAIIDKRFDPQFRWANMIGTAPRRGWGIMDTLLSILAFFLMPFIRRGWEKKCLGDALDDRQHQV